MSRVPTGLADGQLLATSNDIYTVPAESNVMLTSLLLTNTNTAIGQCDIYLTRTNERLLNSVSIPSGIGKAVRVNLLQGINLNASDTLSITANKTGINYDLSGYVVV